MAETHAESLHYKTTHERMISRRRRSTQIHTCVKVHVCACRTDAYAMRQDVFIYKSVSDLNVTIVHPRDINILSKTIFTLLKFSMVYSAHNKNSSFYVLCFYVLFFLLCPIYSSLFSLKILRNKRKSFCCVQNN